jgi:hypothetical protein
MCKTFPVERVTTKRDSENGTRRERGRKKNIKDSFFRATKAGMLLKTQVHGSFGSAQNRGVLGPFEAIFRLFQAQNLPELRIGASLGWCHEPSHAGAASRS